MILILIIFIIGLPLLGWFLFTGLFDLIVGKDNIETPSKDTYITHNYYDNRSVHIHDTKDQERLPL